MKEIYIFTSSKKRSKPYLITSDRMGPYPKHPKDVPWLFWKKATLNATMIGIDPVELEQQITNNGYTILN